MGDFTEQLEALNACEEAIEWVNGRSLRKCWQVADRPDWMLWLAGRLDIDRKTLVLAACDCAETSLKYVPEGEDRPRIAIETARAWCSGSATLEDVEAVARATEAAWAAAGGGAAAWAAWAAAWAAAGAEGAAGATAWAAAEAAEAAANKNLCRLIRKRIPVEMIEEKIGGCNE